MAARRKTGSSPQFAWPWALFSKPILNRSGTMRGSLYAGIFIDFIADPIRKAGKYGMPNTCISMPCFQGFTYATHSLQAAEGDHASDTTDYASRPRAEMCSVLEVWQDPTRANFSPTYSRSTKLCRNEDADSQYETGPTRRRLRTRLAVAMTRHANKTEES